MKNTQNIEMVCLIILCLESFVNYFYLHFIICIFSSCYLALVLKKQINWKIKIIHKTIFLICFWACICITLSSTSKVHLKANSLSIHVV